MDKKSKKKSNLKNKCIKTIKENKKKLLVSSLVFLLVIISVLYFTNTFSIKTKVHNMFGDYTEEIKSVDIDSDDYDAKGSYHIEKSARWLDDGVARIDFDLNSVVDVGNYKDIILVLDISGSMEGEKLRVAKRNINDLINYTFDNSSRHRIALITFDTDSNILSGLSNDRDDLISKVNNLVDAGETNYNKALLNVDEVLKNYQKNQNRDLITMFMTDGYPNIDTPNEVATYNYLKGKYPYMTINGVQYEMGSSAINEIKRISDNQFIASRDTLNNILVKSTLNPVNYDSFKVEDYIDSKYEVLTENDIKTTIGEASLTTEGGLQKITWNLGNEYITGINETMQIKVKLKDQYKRIKGYYPTNNNEKVTSKLPDKNLVIKTSSNTPVLKNYRKIIYDPNSPENNCDLSNYESEEEHFVYSNVNKKTIALSCSGYEFKGWMIEDDNIKIINDDVFMMPDRDIIIRGVWTKISMAKRMDGKVYERTTLYKVMESAAKVGTYAKEYTGNHQDSMAGVGDKKIYHWYAGSNVNETDINNTINNMNNVYFAGQCFKMLRTTDTGGVKLIYNGEYDEINKCNNSRGSHIGYERGTSLDLSGNYYYGTDYTYDPVNKTFAISGGTLVARWSSGANSYLAGMYTCKGITESATCSTLYLLDSYSSSSSSAYAYVIPISSNSHYSQFGSLQFDRRYTTPTHVGYMYNDVYSLLTKSYHSSSTFLDYSSMRNTENYKYFYGDKIIKDGSYYYLQNEDGTDPAQINWSDAESDNEALEGMYTCRSTSTSDITYNGNTIPGGTRCSSVYYVLDINASTMYYQILSGTQIIPDQDMILSNDVEDNGDGTYSLKESGKVTLKRKNCDSSNPDCDTWYSNYSNYNGYFYCSDTTSTTCSAANMRYISSVSSTGGNYISLDNNYKYSKSFEYINGEYILDEDTAITFYNINDATNKTSLNNAHYTCFNTTGKCTELYYIFYINGSNPYYIKLSDGDSIEDAKNKMLYNDDVNQINSTIKTGIDAWYKKYMIPYDNYLEDTIFCNDRTQINESESGWNPNGGSNSTYMYFNNYNAVTDLSCANETDRFSTLNSKAKLTYKVGLFSAPEMNILTNKYIRKTEHYYWLSSPFTFGGTSATENSVNQNGVLDNNYVSVTSNNGVRPAISLKPGTEYKDGDGSMNTPYIVDAENLGAAKIGNKYYETISAALAAVPDNTPTVITVLMDTTASALVVDSNKNVTIDFNGFTLNNSISQPIITTSGTLKIINGSLHSSGNQGIINVTGGSLVVEDTEIIATGNRQAIYITGGTTTILGNSYLSSATNGIPGGGTMERGTVQVISGNLIVAGGKIVGTQQQAISNEGTVTLGTDDSSISTVSPELIGNVNGIRSVGTFNYYDGIIKGGTSAIDGTVSNQPNNTQITNSTETISGKTYQTAYLESTN